MEQPGSSSGSYPEGRRFKSYSRNQQKARCPYGMAGFLFVLVFAPEPIGEMFEMGWLAGIASDAFFVPRLLYPDDSIC